MKPFNLEAANRGDPLVTRCGRPVSEFHHFKTRIGSIYKCVAIIDGDSHAFTEKGSQCTGGESRMDLFMAPKKRTVYLNVYASRYPESPQYPGNLARTFDSRDDAIENGRKDSAVAILIAKPIEIEE